MPRRTNGDGLIRALARMNGRSQRELERRVVRWARRLVPILGNWIQAKELATLALLDGLTLSGDGAIHWTQENLLRIGEWAKEMRSLNGTTWGAGSDFSKWIDDAYQDALEHGITKAENGFRVGSGGDLPGGYRPPGAGILRATKRQLALEIHGSAVSDIEKIRRTIQRHIATPQGAFRQSLRQKLRETRAFTHMVDSAGRAITADERADRIARTEYANIQQDASDETTNRLFGDDPAAIYEMWLATLDSRVSESHAKRHKEVRTRLEWMTVPHPSDGKTGRAPRIRPRCRCGMTAVSPEWFSEKAWDDLKSGKVAQSAQAA